MTIEFKMNWISDSPHTEIRVSLLAYLRLRLKKWEAFGSYEVSSAETCGRIRGDLCSADAPCGTHSPPEVVELKLWIAWLSGDVVTLIG